MKRKTVLYIGWLFIKSGIIIIHSALFETKGLTKTINSLLDFQLNYDVGKIFNNNLMGEKKDSGSDIEDIIKGAVKMEFRK